MLPGSNKERVTFNQLTITGFCRDMREETDTNSKYTMLDYLIALLDDSNDFSRASAKASHAVLLCCMEQGEIKDFTVTDKIDRDKRANAQRHTIKDQDVSKKPAKDTHSKAMACQYYTSGTCSQQNTHKTKGVLYQHGCFCSVRSLK